MKLHKWESALLIGLLFAIFASGLTTFMRGCEALRGSVLRLHILANSDQPCDQQVKLEVRDRLLERFGEELGAASGKEAAKRQADALLPQIEEAAEEVIREDGFDYPVRAQRVRMYFETRSYGDITLPAGMYDAVRVTIGEARGHNWWCVLYPPVCIYSAADSEQLQALSSDAVAGRSPRYEPRFKLVEWIEGCKTALVQKGNRKAPAEEKGGLPHSQPLPPEEQKKERESDENTPAG